MRVVVYSVVLNQHQAPVADWLWKLTNHQFVFVELSNLGDTKGGNEDYSNRPYLLRAWQSTEAFNSAMELARSADSCIFSGVDSLPFEKERMRLGLFSFEMGERWLKNGWMNMVSPRLLKWLCAFYLGGWKDKPLYKLCMSAFAANDHHRLGTFKDKCYKWGYFTKVEDFDVEASPDVSTSNITPLMWCSRYLTLKHPELPVFLAKKLKERSFHFVIDMYGSGECEQKTKALVRQLQVEDVVHFKGTLPNNQLMKEMKRHDIFLFTSDRNEGWGAVANESMGNGCALVASDAIGSVPYLIQPGVNGLTFRSAATNSGFEHPDMKALDDLTEKVMWLLDHKGRMKEIQRNAALTLQYLWSPRHAAQSLLQLMDDLQNGRETSIKEGPCSKA